MIDTSFQKKTLYEAITGLLIGLIFLVCPIFVSATVAQPKALPYVYDGNTYTQTFGSGNHWFYCTEDCFPYMHADYILICKEDDGGCSYFPEHYAYFNCSSGCPENPSAVNGQYMATDGWTASVDDMHSTKDVKDYGGYDYQGYRGGLHIVANLEVVHIADIEPPPPVCGIDHCSYCETSEDCQSAGCIYEYNTGFARWECHQEYIAYVYGCGLGDCGCPDQETCEGAEPVGTCEWVDRGYGEGCYEVEEAPPEAEWEAPELENCDELSGVEKWLCEIKNWLAGLFMPTQEKVNNLKKTIDNFKAKFPFNYAGALSAFFTTLKTSLDTEKNIPIKVLGVEGDVNFSFWEQTTTIGGTPETFKNILYDFTTAIVIIAFIFWIISFIKRIF